MSALQASPHPGGRPITLSRENTVFRLAFTFRRDLVEAAKALHYAAFDPDTRSWTAMVCAQTLQALRGMYHRGLLDISPDQLLAPGENPPPVADALVRPGRGRTPYLVNFATRNHPRFAAFRGIPGARWDKKNGALAYPSASAAALAELVDRGHLADPDKLLSVAEVTVCFDTRTGWFSVRGNPRAAEVFAASFPRRDVVAEWKAKGLDVDFLDEHTVRMYRGEIARASGQGFTPAGIKLPLMPYQAVSVAVALEREGFAIFDQMGLGKSVQGIAVGTELLARNEISRVVVVVPAAVRTQWAREISKFTDYGPVDITVVRGRDRTQRLRAYSNAEETPWMIVHYDILSRDLDELKPLFAGALVIADEAHRVKNYKSARTQALLTLSRNARRRLALTGTPVETNPSEWYQVLSGFACPGALGTPGEFNERYRYKALHGGYEGKRNLPELRERSRPYFIRHTKAQVAAHLPPLRVTTTALDPSPAYEAALRRAHTEAVEEIRNAQNGDARNGGTAGRRMQPGGPVLISEEEAAEPVGGAEMTAVGQLRLLCSSPRLINADSDAGKALLDAGLVPDEDGPKVDEVRTICAELLATQQDRQSSQPEGHVPTAAEVTDERVVIFTFSKRMANLLAERLTEDGVNHVMFTGDTSADDRDAAVTAFTDPTSDVIAFIATDAAAEGLNLGTCCAYLINVDLPWTPSKLAQRSQRIHRLDAAAAHYQVTNLIVAGTLEHGIVRLLEARTEMADTLFGERGGRRTTTGTRTRVKAANVFLAALAEHTKTDDGDAQGELNGARPAKKGVPAQRTTTPARPPQPRQRNANAAADGADDTQDEDGQLLLL